MKIFQKRMMFFCFLFLLTIATQVCGQERYNTEIRLNFGKTAFLDESIPFDHTLIGGSFRFYLTPRLAIEPEFAYLRGPVDDRDYLFFPNIVFDVARFESNRIYVIGSPGLLVHCDEFPGALDPHFCSREWTATGGVGAKIFLTEHLFAGGEFRWGWEPFFRISGSIGYAFGKKE